MTHVVVRQWATIARLSHAIFRWCTMIVPMPYTALLVWTHKCLWHSDVWCYCLEHTHGYSTVIYGVIGLSTPKGRWLSHVRCEWLVLHTHGRLRVYVASRWWHRGASNRPSDEDHVWCLPHWLILCCCQRGVVWCAVCCGGIQRVVSPRPKTLVNARCWGLQEASYTWNAWFDILQ